MNEAALIAALGVLITVVAVLVPRIVKRFGRRQRRRAQAQRWRGNGSGES